MKLLEKIKRFFKRKNVFRSKSDPSGSYTGTPTDGNGKVEQDVDDL